MNIDKKSITKIKELADSGEIDLNSLSHEDLQVLFDEEIASQLESKTYDMTFLNKVAEALGKADDPEFSGFWQRDYTADDLRKLAESRSFTDRAPNTDAVAGKNGLRRIKRTVAVAACIILAAVMLTLTAYATVPSLNSIIRSVLRMPVGSSIDDEGTTYINAGKTKQYSSLDELLEAEQLDDYGLIFPKGLPDELSISSVIYVEYNDVKEISIIFSGGAESMGIYIGRDIGAELPETQLLINGFTVYISETEDVYASMMSYNNNLYCMTSANKGTIITIFEHMSGGVHR